MRTKSAMGLFGLGLCLTVALLMATPVSAVNGYYTKDIVFSDDFDVRTRVDFDEWETLGVEDDYTIDYDAMNVSWDVARNHLVAGENWSYGIWTQTDITNATIHSNNDVYLEGDMDGLWEFWDGIIDNDELEITDEMTAETVGQVGVAFLNSNLMIPIWEKNPNNQINSPFPINYDNGIYVWYVDTTDTLQFKNVSVDMDTNRWYGIEITYEPDAKTAIVNVTDSVTLESDSVSVTKIRFPEAELNQFFFGWNEGLPTYFSKGGMQTFATTYLPVAYVDNVEIYNWKFVPTTTPTPQPVPPVYYEQDYGMWIGVAGAMLGVIGLVFYTNIEKYLSSIGYINSGAIATIPAIVGGIMVLGGLGLYYGYFGHITYKFW